MSKYDGVFVVSSIRPYLKYPSILCSTSTIMGVDESEIYDLTWSKASKVFSASAVHFLLL